MHCISQEIDPKGKVSMHCSRHALIGLLGHCPEAKTHFTAVVDLHSKILDACPPCRSKFFQFHAVFGKIWQNCMLVPPCRVGTPSSGKSWIHHCTVSNRDPIQHTTRGQSNFPLFKIVMLLHIYCTKVLVANSITAHIYANCDRGIVNRSVTK